MLWRPVWGSAATRTHFSGSAGSPCWCGAAARPAAPPATLGLLWLLQILRGAGEGCQLLPPITHIIKTAGVNRGMFHFVPTSSCSSLHSSTLGVFFLPSCWHQAQHQIRKILPLTSWLADHWWPQMSKVWSLCVSPLVPFSLNGCASLMKLQVNPNPLCSSRSPGIRHWGKQWKAIGSNTWEDKTVRRQDWPSGASDSNVGLAEVQPCEQGIWSHFPPEEPCG